MSVALPSFRSFAFESGIERIRTSFRASVAAMQDEQRRTQIEYERYLGSGEDDDEHDVDGVLISSSRVCLEFANLEATIALNVVREAFIISVFHYWERSARAWTRNHNRCSFDKLMKDVSAEGIEVSDELSLLNSLNNLLKHDNPDRGREVFDKRPDLFLFGRVPKGSWQSALQITNTDVEGFIDVVKTSGPTAAP